MNSRTINDPEETSKKAEELKEQNKVRSLTFLNIYDPHFNSGQ